MPASELARLNEILAPHGNQFLVGVANGAVRTIPTDTSAQAWQRGINRSDGATPSISFGSPDSAATK